MAAADGPMAVRVAETAAGQAAERTGTELRHALQMIGDRAPYREARVLRSDGGGGWPHGGPGGRNGRGAGSGAHGDGAAACVADDRGSGALSRGAGSQI